MIELIDPYEDDKENEDVVNRIWNVMSLIRKDGVFAGKQDRFAISYFSYLIRYDNKDIGFIYATPERRYRNGLFIDMALLKEYRGKGIGKEVLEKFCLIHNNIYMFGEVLEYNKASNIISSKVGVEIAPGYYLFPKDKYEEFINSGELDKFLNNINQEELSGRELLRALMNNRGN